MLKANTIEQFGAFLAASGAPSAPARERVRLHVIDTLGALVAASRTAEGKALIAFSAATPPDEPTMLVALTRLSEIDDIHLASMTTPGAIVVPATLVIAATLPNCDGERLSAAILAGYEAMVRLGCAIDGRSILYRGIWPTYLAAPFGVAAAASCLLRLDAAQAAHALALALSYASPGVGRHNAVTTARWLSVGHAAASGLAAARAARAGFTADTVLLDGGFFREVYGITPNPGAITDALGERDVLAEVSFKPWCAARQTMAATQAFCEIIAGGVNPGEIVAIKALVLPPHRRMIDHGVTPGDRASYLTSLPYNMAVAALAPVLADALSPVPESVPAAVHALMRRITVEADERLLADYPQTWRARVVVTTASGSQERSVAAVPGDPSHPFGAPEVTAKFKRFVTPVVGEDRMAALLSASSSVVAGDRTAADVLKEVKRNL